MSEQDRPSPAEDVEGHERYTADAARDETDALEGHRRIADVERDETADDAEGHLGELGQKRPDGYR